MFKMKSLFSIVAIFSLALVSCTERIPESQMPDVDNGVITMITASVEPLELKGVPGVGNYQWNETHTIGIYGTAVGENECYLPVNTTLGGSEAQFFGNEVGGDMTIYMPYVSGGSEAACSGRVTVPVAQNYYADALDHFMYNSTFLATARVGEVTFGYNAGLLKIALKYDIENVKSVAVMVGNLTTDGTYDDYLAGDIAVDADTEQFLVNGSNRLVVSNIPEGLNSTIAEPATVWAVLAPGVYQNLVIEITNEAGTTATPVEGPFVVEKCALCEKVCVAEEKKYDNGVGDFEGENGEFNPLN